MEADPRLRGCGKRALLLLLKIVHTCQCKARIAYITNAWWPKIDGAAITVMGHAHFFASEGHPVLVVRPIYDIDSPLMARAKASGIPPPPLHPSMQLEYLDYRASGLRGGGFEPKMHASDLSRVEAQLAQWSPDIMLVMDPDMFVLDAFRIPGFNLLMRQERAPVTIATFTSFCLEAVLKMPEYWWLSYSPMYQLFLQGIALAYAHFDHTFVNGEPSRNYLEQLRVLHGWGTQWHPLGDVIPLRVVPSRGVAADFCSWVPAATCDALPSVKAMRAAGAQVSEAAVGQEMVGMREVSAKRAVAFAYVGRLSYDKSVNVLLSAFEQALKLHAVDGRDAVAQDNEAIGQQFGAAAAWPVLYIVGSGELEALVRSYVQRLRGQVVYLGQVAHANVSCLLREAHVYVSAAHSETYGRSLVEAFRCGLPVVTMASCNMHVTHARDGLLAWSTTELTQQLHRMMSDSQLRDALRSGAAARNRADESEPNRAMLEAVLTAHNQSRYGGARRRRAWHPFWSLWMWLSVALDYPRISSASAVLAASLAMRACIWPSCSTRPSARRQPSFTNRKVR